MNIDHLKKELADSINECERFEKSVAKKGQYTDAIKLIGMVDAYKRVLNIISR